MAFGDKVKVSVLETNGVDDNEGPSERSLTADIVDYDDTVSQLGADETQTAIVNVKAILDALPDAMPVLQGNFTTIGSIIPSTWTAYPLSQTIATQTQVIDINPGADTQVRLKEAGTYFCYYSFDAFEDGNPDIAQSRVTANGGGAILGSETVGYGEAGNGSSALEFNLKFSRGFLYTAAVNDYLELEAQNLVGDYELTTPVTFVVVKMDAQFANFMFSAGDTPNRATLEQGGVSEFVQGTNQTVTGTATTIINWQNQDLFDDACFSHTPGDSEIVLDKAGRYRILSKVNYQRTANGRVQSNAFWQSAPSAGAFTDIEKSYSHAYTRSSDASNFGNCTAVFTYDAAAGDRLRCGVFNNEAPAVCNLLGARTNVVIEYIGENP